MTWSKRWPVITERHGPMPRLRLFAYGTLRPETGTRMGRWIERRLLWSEAASIPGRIFAVPEGSGWVPALVAPKGSRRVRGLLCELDLTRGERALLDCYEGGEYRRTVASVRTDRGATLAAQVYLWRIPVPEGGLAIRSGDFLAWREEKRRSTYWMPRGSA
jgi:gamma-glutamylcyclotransferase (GGCT)/AIG2-like uncharacterized protein YtfP